MPRYVTKPLPKDPRTGTTVPAERPRVGDKTPLKKTTKRRPTSSTLAPEVVLREPAESKRGQARETVETPGTVEPRARVLAKKRVKGVI